MLISRLTNKIIIKFHYKVSLREREELPFLF